MKDSSATPRAPKTSVTLPESLAQKLQVDLKRDDFIYFNWVLAFERPVLPFLIYTFIGLVLAGFIGIWPDAQVYAAAAFFPLMGYALWIFVRSDSLWRKNSSIQASREYSFKATDYEVKSENRRVSVPYSDVLSFLESRSAFYMLRKDGSADIVLKEALKAHDIDSKAFRAEFTAKTALEVRRSSFL